MLWDLHAHTSAISWCCQAPAQKIIEIAKENGYGGLVVTNHYASAYFNDSNYDEWIDSYVAEWNNCIEIGNKLGVRVLRGIEVTMDYNPNVHLLVYGCDESFIRNNRRLEKLSQQQLYDLCHKNGCILVNAHPFRNGTTVQNVSYLDGVELNFHKIYVGSCKTKDVVKIAQDNKLALTAGCDYHHDTPRSQGGILLPNYVASEQDLAQWLTSASTFDILVDDPDDNAKYKATFCIEK